MHLPKSAYWDLGSVFLSFLKPFSKFLNTSALYGLNRIMSKANFLYPWIPSAIFFWFRKVGSEYRSNFPETNPRKKKFDFLIFKIPRQ